MDLVLVANEPELALAAEAAGIERVLVDLERRGKELRQQGRNLFLTTHVPDDVDRLREVLDCCRVQVRVDPWHDGSEAQVADVLVRGADVVMLPMVESVADAECFVAAVAGRAMPSLLVETQRGVDALDGLVAIPGVAEVHVGLNDLMLSRGDRVPFEAFVDGTADAAATVVRESGVRFGIGGVAPPATPDLPVDPTCLLGELVRLGVTVGWLGRSFRRCLASDDLSSCVAALRTTEERWRAAAPATLEANRRELVAQVGAWAIRANSDRG